MRQFSFDFRDNEAAVRIVLLENDGFAAVVERNQADAAIPSRSKVSYRADSLLVTAENDITVLGLESRLHEEEISFENCLFLRYASRHGLPLGANVKVLVIGTVRNAACVVVGGLIGDFLRFSCAVRMSVAETIAVGPKVMEIIFWVVKSARQFREDLHAGLSGLAGSDVSGKIRLGNPCRSRHVAFGGVRLPRPDVSGENPLELLRERCRTTASPFHFWNIIQDPFRNWNRSLNSDFRDFCKEGLDTWNREGIIVPVLGRELSVQVRSRLAAQTQDHGGQ